MPLEVGGHAADRLLRDGDAVGKVSRARDADRGHAALRRRLLAADLERARGVRRDGGRRLGVDVLERLVPTVAHGDGDGDRLVLRISLVEQRPNLLRDAVLAGGLLLGIGVHAERQSRVLTRALRSLGRDRLRFRGRLLWLRARRLADRRRDLTAAARAGGARRGGLWRQREGRGRDAAERRVVEQQTVGGLVLGCGQTLQLAGLVDRHQTARDRGADALELEALVREHWIVIREECVVLDAEQREERLVQRLLVHPKQRKDRVCLPRREADLRRREVRVVRLQHRHGNAEYRGDLLDDLDAAGEILRRESHRLQIDIRRHREEPTRPLAAAQLLVDLHLQPLDLLGRCHALEGQQVVGPGAVGEEGEVHLVDGLVRHRRAPCGLGLAETVVEVGGIRPLEVDHLIVREEAPLLAACAVEKTVDQLLLAGDDLHPLARHDPEFGRTAERLVDHGMEVGVASEFGIEDAQHGAVEAVGVRVELGQHLEHGVHLGDDLVVVAVLGGLRHHSRRRLRGHVAREVRLRPQSWAARLPKRLLLAASAHIEADRLRRHRDGVEIGRRVDPAAVGVDCGERGERLPLAIASVHHLHRGLEIPLRGECTLDSGEEVHQMTFMMSGRRCRRAWSASASAQTPSSWPAVASY